MKKVETSPHVQNTSVQNYIELSTALHQSVSTVIRKTAQYNSLRAGAINGASQKLSASQRWGGQVSLLESGAKIGLFTLLSFMPARQNQWNALTAVTDALSRGMQTKEQAQQSQYDHTLNTQRFGRDTGSSSERALSEILRQFSDSASNLHRSFSDMIREMLRPV